MSLTYSIRLQTLIWLHMKTFPKNVTQQIITVLNTTSIEKFNNLGIKLCNDLITLELQASANSTMVQASQPKLKNNIQIVYYFLKYTLTVYNDIVQQGI